MADKQSTPADAKPQPGLQKSESSILTKMKAGLSTASAKAKDAFDSVKQKFDKSDEQASDLEISAPESVSHIGHVGADDVKEKSLKELGVAPEFLPFVVAVNAALRERGAPPLTPQEASILYRSSTQITTLSPPLPPKPGAPPLPAKSVASPATNEPAVQLRIQQAEKELELKLAEVTTLSSEIEQLQKILQQKQAKLKVSQKRADILGDELIALYEQQGSNSASTTMKKDPQAVLKHMVRLMAINLLSA